MELRVQTRRRIDPWVQSVLPLEWLLPSGVPAQPTVASARIVQHGSSRATTTEVNTRPEAATWSAMLLQAALEVLAGRRPLSQLTRWVDFDVYRDLGAADRTPRARTPVISSVHVSQIDPDIVEVCAVLVTHTRSRAAVIRLEGRATRWRCTRLAIL